MNPVYLCIEIRKQQNALLDSLEADYGTTTNFPSADLWKLSLMSEYIIIATKN